MILCLNIVFLKKKYKKNKNIYLNNYALASKIEEKIFYQSFDSSSSSFIKINKNSFWFKEKKKKSEMLNIKHNMDDEKILKSVSTIENYVNKKKIKFIDFLKIDAQGFDVEVLMGCKSLIKQNKIAAILTEVILSDIYQKYTNFLDIEKILLPNFRLVGFNNKKSNFFKEPSFGINVLYFNKKIFNLK